MVATAAESPTPLPRVHELDYRSGLGADRYGFGIAGDTGIDPYRRSRSRQSTSSRPSYSGSTSGLRRSLSSNKLSPNGNTSAASGLNGSSSAFARPHSSAAFTKPSSRNVSGNEASKFRYAKEDESSDDDVPAPIKFSASVRALLEEDGGPGVSELKSSPRSQSRSPVVRSSRPSVEGGDQMHEPLYQSSNRSKYQVDSQAMATASKPARQVRIASPRRLSSPRTSSQHVHGDMKNTPSPSSSPRLVKVTGRSPSALSYFRRSPSQPTSDRSVRTQRTGSDASEASNVKDHHTGKEENNHENFVTPAPGPRKRAVRVSGSRRDSPTAEQDGFPATGGQHSNYYRHFEQPTRDEHMMEESYLNNKHDERDFEGSIRPTPVMRPWAGMNSIHAGDEAGIASTRVKRVGKLTGSFLKGPARRGVLRRQSEEERQLERERQIEEHDSEGERERDVQLDPVTPSPEARDPAR
ncbi:Dual-specificity kinase, spindle pole body (SPB) duplication and spindle checkpoint function, partial [Ascosphaera atra]